MGERSVILDEVDPTIRANLESRAWLSLLEIDHPPLTALIREFFLNLSCHVYDFNTLVKIDRSLGLINWNSNVFFCRIPTQPYFN